MIRLEDVYIEAGQFALRKVNLSVQAGKYVALMGKTGCGKTTLLEAICGLRPIQRGKIFVGEHNVTDATPADRRLGYVPQDLALFPTMTVRQHLQFALKLRKVDASWIEQRTNQLAGELSIAHLLDRLPAGLSGGEAQRVALGRALSFEPPVLLLDEPLSALDDTTREELVELLKELRDSRTVTVIHITHNRAEAEQLGDQVVRLQDCTG